MRRRSLLYRFFSQLLLTLVALLYVFPLLATERGVKRVESYNTADRHALVIGNSNYEKAGRLRNPVNDANAMSRTLKRLGFKVTTLRNANLRAMERAISSFGKRLRGGGVGLFFYAGHGMQVDGENYLIPVDANPESESDLRYEAVQLGRMLNRMADAQNGMNIVILDACRNNPFARSFRSSERGLAQVSAPTGTFISYATGPGKVASDGKGRYGLYTEKLIARMTTPGLSLERIFKRVRADVQQASNGKQVPWDSSSLIGDFYFVPLADSLSDGVEVTDELSEEPLETQPDLEPPVEYERSEKTSKGTLRFDGPLKINSLEQSDNHYKNFNTFSLNYIFSGGFGVGLTTVTVPTITATQRVYSGSTYSNNNYGIKIDYNLFDMSYNFDPFLIGYSVLIDGKINYQGLYRYSTKKYHYGDEAIEIIENFFIHLGFQITEEYGIYLSRRYLQITTEPNYPAYKFYIVTLGIGYKL